MESVSHFTNLFIVEMGETFANKIIKICIGVFYQHLSLFTESNHLLSRICFREVTQTEAVLLFHDVCGKEFHSHLRISGSGKTLPFIQL